MQIYLSHVGLFCLYTFFLKKKTFVLLANFLLYYFIQMSICLSYSHFNMFKIHVYFQFVRLHTIEFKNVDLNI